MKYYVYHLVDPRYDRVFYIGKGTGSRWRQHMHNRKPRGRPNAGNFMKADIIASLKRAGLEPVCRKIGLFEDEAAAYAFEAECIAEANRGGMVIANYNDGRRAA
jgi:hypothetical protein